MLFDRSTGKKYIGSAYGENGIWKRWSDYIYSNNGGNKEMLQLDNDYLHIAMKCNNENHSNNYTKLSGHYPPILDLLSQDYSSIASRLDSEPRPFFIFSESFVRSVV